MKLAVQSLALDLSERYNLKIENLSIQNPSYRDYTTIFPFEDEDEED